MVLELPPALPHLLLIPEDPELPVPLLPWVAGGGEGALAGREATHQSMTAGLLGQGGWPSGGHRRQLLSDASSPVYVPPDKRKSAILQSPTGALHPAVVLSGLRGRRHN